MERITIVSKPAKALANTDVARRLFARRKDFGLTLRQAADEVGVSFATLFRLETKAEMPDLETALAVSQWLKIPVETLFRRRK